MWVERSIETREVRRKFCRLVLRMWNGWVWVSSRSATEKKTRTSRSFWFDIEGVVGDPFSLSPSDRLALPDRVSGFGINMRVCYARFFGFNAGE